MATTPLAQALLQGYDPTVFRPLQDIQTGDALTKQGMDASPTSKWGAIGRLAQAAAGSYLSNSATSDLARTIGAGKKSAQEQLLAAIEASQKVPAAPPVSGPLPSVQPSATAQSAPVASTQQTPQVQPAVPAPAQPYNPDTFKAQAEALASGGTAPSAPLAAAAPASDGPNYGGAIANIESGGKYDTLGPVTKAGDRAYGKYQVMGANIPEWTQAILGKKMTPQEFLASPEAQEAVFKGKFGEYAQKYGPEGAAKAWFAGEHGMNNPNAKDQLGTTVQAYADKFNAGLGGQPGPQAIDAAAGHPVQLVQAAPPTATDATSARGGLDVHKLLAVMQNPYSDEATKALASKLLLKQLDPEEEFASSPQGIFNKRTGELKQGLAGNYGGLQGPELLAALKQQNPTLASQVQSVGEYKTAFPTGSRLNPIQQQIKELVTLAYPDYSAPKYQARKNFESNMAATVPNSFGGQIRSAGTVAKHLGDAHDALADIESGPLGASNTLPILNGVKGFIRDQAGSETYQNAIGHYNTAIKGLADEAENLLANGHGAEGSKLYWKDRLDLSKHSPTEVRGALDEFRSLMMGRVSNVAQEKDRVFDQVPGSTDPLTLFGPKERDIMKKINDDTYKGKVVSGDAPTPSAAPAAPLEKTIGDKTYVKRGDQWFEK